MTNEKKIVFGDYLIGLAVFIQPVLILMQHVLIDVLKMNPDTTTTYRVVLTAVPMLLAIAVGFYRKSFRFILVYVLALLVLLLTVLIFPLNERYVKTEGLRFLLPLIIPSAVCLTTVENMDVLKKSLNITAWLSAVLVFFYTFSYFAGQFVIDSYNMSFSYGCLLPMIVLYSQRRVIPTIVSLFLFLVVLAIGSRGGAIIFVAYVIVDALINRRKGRWLVLVMGFVFVLFLPFLKSFFDSIGIGSRTLGLLNAGDIAYDSGREDIYSTCVNALNEHPIGGFGLFGDRVLLEGAYCHNFFLEICLNFGVFLGLLIVFVLLLCFIKSWRASKGDNRDFLLIITFGCFLPYMVSGSYLVSNNIALWIGIILLLIKNRMSEFDSEFDIK